MRGLEQDLYKASKEKSDFDIDYSTKSSTADDDSDIAESLGLSGGGPFFFPTDIINCKSREHINDELRISQSDGL